MDSHAGVGMEVAGGMHQVAEVEGEADSCLLVVVDIGRPHVGDPRYVSIQFRGTISHAEGVWDIQDNVEEVEDKHYVADLATDLAVDMEQEPWDPDDSGLVEEAQAADTGLARPWVEVRVVSAVARSMILGLTPLGEGIVAWDAQSAP